ncbi:MAG: hypothetical protein AAGF83_24145 [Cyanobacteria bacterium P01_G01_bin.67]
MTNKGRTQQSCESRRRGRSFRVRRCRASAPEGCFAPIGAVSVIWAFALPPMY